MQLKRLAYDLIKRFVAVRLLNVVHVCITEGLMEDKPLDLGSHLPAESAAA
jgi:hypothetical protein